MIDELRIYRCVPGRKPALLSRFENETLRIWEKHGTRQAGFLDHADRQEQPGDHLHARLGQHGRAREALGRFSRGPLMGRGSRQDGEGWPACREHQQPVAGASRVLCREVSTLDARMILLSQSCELTLPGGGLSRSFLARTYLRPTHRAAVRFGAIARSYYRRRFSMLLRVSKSCDDWMDRMAAVEHASKTK